MRKAGTCHNGVRRTSSSDSANIEQVSSSIGPIPRLSIRCSGIPQLPIIARLLMAAVCLILPVAAIGDDQEQSNENVRVKNALVKVYTVRATPASQALRSSQAIPSRSVECIPRG